MKPTATKPGKFFYVIAVLSALMASWLFFSSTIPHLEEFFTLTYFSPSAFYIITAWLDPLARLAFIAGGVFAFFKPKLSWFLFVGAAACHAFQLWNYLSYMMRSWTAYVLLPIPNQPSLFVALLPNVLFMVLLPLSLFYFFFCRAGREINWRNKIIYICIFIVCFIALYFISPQFKYGEVGGWGADRY